MFAIREALAGWGATFRAIAAMPVLYLSAYVALLMICFGLGLPPRLGAVAIGLAILAAASILASVLVGLHRHILLAEANDRAVWQAPPFYGQFLTWVLAFDLGFAPAMAAAPISVLLAGALAAAGLVFSLGTMLLLPGVALGATGGWKAQWLAGWRDARGHAWSYLVRLALGGLPLLLLPAARAAAPNAFWIAAPGGALALLLGASVSAAISARAFEVDSIHVRVLPRRPAV